MKEIPLTLLILILFNSCVGSWKSTNINNTDIVEKKRIGKYSLSMTRDELDSIEEAKIDTLQKYTIYTLPNVKIWFDNFKKRTDQICACNNYQGKFREEVGVGYFVTKLSKVSKYYWDEEEEVFLLKSIKGISFNIPDEHLKVVEHKKQIDYICIYR